MAAKRGVALPAAAVDLLRQAMLRLPAHPDAEPALRQLREARFVLAVLSNNSLPVLRARLAHAGLALLFDHILSVDQARALKPAPEVYRLALERLAQPPGSVWMVAAHGWDIAGASRAGMRGAFVARPGQLADPFAPPEISGADLTVVARAMLRSDAAAD